MKNHILFNSYIFLLASLVFLPLGWATEQILNPASTESQTPEIYQQLRQGLAYAEQMIGHPLNPIAKVTLKTGNRLAQTTISSLSQGQYTISLTRLPQEISFQGQLAHETCHLLNPQLYDAYFEGFCTVFAEEYLRQEGLDWKIWSDYFRKGHEAFYGQTYFLMREIVDTIGIRALQDFHTYTLTESQPDRKKIDIERWLSTLSDHQQMQVRQLIGKYSLKIKQAIGQDKKQVAFHLPSTR